MPNFEKSLQAKDAPDAIYVTNIPHNMFLRLYYCMTTEYCIEYICPHNKKHVCMNILRYKGMMVIYTIVLVFDLHTR